MTIPVCVLAVLSIVGGFDKAPFARFMAIGAAHAVGSTPAASRKPSQAWSRPSLFYAVFWRAWFVYQRNPALAAALVENPVGPGCCTDSGFRLGHGLALRPALRAAVVWIARVNKADVVDSIYDGLASLATFCYRVLSLTETGRLRWYAAWIAGGTVAFVAIVMFL